MHPAGTSVANRGLSAAEVAERVGAGLANDVEETTSRTIGQIVRANTLTLFNAVIGVLFALIMVFGNWRDGLFALVALANTGVGIVQELRAKRTLDRLAVVGEARPTVRRDGVAVGVRLHEVVRDDVLLLSTGDRVVVDGVVVESDGLEIDESLLTGEADAVHEQVGAEVMSGSFVVAGQGAYVATRVGQEAYAAQLAAEARTFTLVRSELRDGVNRILQIMTVLIVPVGALLVWSQFRTQSSVAEAVSGAVAGVVTMIPEGLVLLTSIAFAAGVVRLGREQVLVQELPAIEGLARVDVICLDKTGTLTEPGMRVRDVEVLDAAGEPVPVDLVLAALAAAEAHPNASLLAIRDRFGQPPAGWAVVSSVPFSSARKWSGVCFGEQGSWVLGAPEVLLTEDGGPSSAALARSRALAEQGLRVLLTARAAGELTGPDDVGPLTPVALVSIEQRLKDDAAETLRYFASQGVAVKVISGDSPVTVGAVVAQLGVRRPDGAVAVGFDARDLPEDPTELAAVMEREVAFGRVSPAQKQRMVRALQGGGHVVAMTGDGVNDVLALKDADIGIAMASGSDATRAVAQLVLVDSRFQHLPGVVAEGRRVINNIELVANLFLTKTVYATVLAVLSGVAGLAFPFLPRHLTVVSALTIGVPGFFLALAPNTALARRGFVRRVLWFAVPAGVVCAVGAFAAYYLGLIDPDVSNDQARSLAAIVLFLVAWWVVIMIARPLTPFRLLLALALVAGFVLVLSVPALQRFFAFDLAPAYDVIGALGVAGASILVLEGLWRISRRISPHWPPA
jgi:cation-transporting ATPase E